MRLLPNPMWQHAYSIETNASPEAIWKLFSDVPNWKKWNAGIESIEIQGPFSAGTVFIMTPPGQEPLFSRLVEVRENEAFVDETRVDDVVVLVTHRIDSLASGRTCVTYAVQVSGPSAEEIGRAVSSDFPDVLKALVALAQSGA